MKTIMKSIALLCTLMMLTMISLAEPGLDAAMDGATLVVRWSDASGGTLTIYRDGWPICVQGVSAASGEKRLAIGEATGKLTVRLKTDSGCLSADVNDRPSLESTAKPTSKPTPATTARPDPTTRPAKAPTSKPTPTQTAAATKKPTEVSIRKDLADQVVALVNAERAKQGLSALRVDAGLTRAACVRGAEITRTFSHTRPDGTPWRTVSVLAYGENIARGQRTAEKVMAAWMTSEGHRANILRASYGAIGVCACVSDGVIHWVQLFGK